MILQPIELDEEFVEQNIKSSTVKYGLAPKDYFECFHSYICSKHNPFGSLQVYDFDTRKEKLYRMYLNGTRVDYITDTRALKGILEAGIKVIILEKIDNDVIPYKLVQ